MGSIRWAVCLHYEPDEHGQPKGLAHSCIAIQTIYSIWIRVQIKWPVKEKRIQLNRIELSWTHSFCRYEKRYEEDTHLLCVNCLAEIESFNIFVHTQFRTSGDDTNYGHVSTFSVLFDLKMKRNEPYLHLPFSMVSLEIEVSNQNMTVSHFVHRHSRERVAKQHLVDTGQIVHSK